MPNYQDILTQIQLDVTDLLTTALPPSLHYHNLTHTAFVVEASQEIGKAMSLDQEALDLLAIAAWWHDVGYIETVREHEMASQIKAKAYLKAKSLEERAIETILGCIAATQIPQSPQNLLEEIICDADLAHLAARDFVARCRPLRKEWETLGSKKMTEIEWLEVNESFMNKHTYFTTYGKEVLTIRKTRNLKRITTKLQKLRQPKIVAPPQSKKNDNKTLKILDKSVIS